MRTETLASQDFPSIVRRASHDYVWVAACAAVTEQVIEGVVGRFL
jgi:hypothetical protein